MIEPARPGLFITFEGVEGSGKTTQADMLARALAPYEPLLFREPGGTEFGERVRQLVLHTPGRISGEAEMYLFMAARAELIAERILPALRDGRVVIADRYHDSTRAYQGGGRGVQVEWPLSFPTPDLTILLAVSPDAGLNRRLAGGKAADRLESESLDFHRAVAAAYDRIAAEQPGRWLRLDAALGPEAVHDQVLQRVGPLLKEVIRSSSS